MTVAAFLEYQAALHGVNANRMGPLLRETLSRTALTEKAHQPIATLSRGYRQRVGVAQAILHRPRVLILDEPTNGLDPTQIQHMRGLLRELAREATLIVSTHILQEVQAVCDRVLILQHGRKALDASLADLRAGQRLLVTLEPNPKAAALLNDLEEVTRIERLADEDGLARFALTSALPARELAPLVADTVASRGFRIHGLVPESRSLETIFNDISLTGGLEQ